MARRPSARMSNVSQAVVRVDSTSSAASFARSAPAGSDTTEERDRDGATDRAKTVTQDMTNYHDRADHRGIDSQNSGVDDLPSQLVAADLTRWRGQDKLYVEEGPADDQTQW